MEMQRGVLKKSKVFYVTALPVALFAAIADVQKTILFNSVYLKSLGVVLVLWAICLVLTCGGFTLRKQHVKLTVPLIVLLPIAAVTSIMQGDIWPILSSVFFFLTVLSVLLSLDWKAYDLLADIIKCEIAIFIAIMWLSIGVNAYGSSLSYSGVFNNPNAFGRYNADIFLLAFFYLALFKGRIVTIANIILLAIMVLSFFMIFKSTSRGAVVSLVFPLFLAALFWSIRQSLKIILTYNIDKKLIQKTILALAFIAILAGVIYHFNLYSGVVDKTIRLAQSGNVSDNRFDIWNKLLNNVQFWGYQNYVEKLNMYYGAHNNYIGSIMTFGLPFSIFYYLFFIIILFWFARVAWRSESVLAYMGLVFIVKLLLEWMFTETMYTMPVWIVIMCAGCLLSTHNKGSREQSNRNRPA